MNSALIFLIKQKSTGKHALEFAFKEHLFCGQLPFSDVLERERNNLICLMNCTLVQHPEEEICHNM